MRRLVRLPVRVAARLGDYALAHTPRILITDTYQVMFAFALLGTGITSLLVLFTPSAAAGAIGSALANQILRGLWAVSLLVGGAAQIVGVHYSSRDVERAGIALSGIGCLVYALALGAYAQTVAGFILCGFFAVLAGGFFLRLKVSSVARRLGST